MPSPVDDDWSDSEDEALSGVETSVYLGVPDGPIDVASDIADVAVSRIGGYPAFLLAREIPFSSSFCKTCSNPMELLVQMWCPLEDSPMDRALYVWGCPRIGCQGKLGSVRAWRGLRFNEKYAIKLEKKHARKQEKEKERANTFAKEAEKKKNETKFNPFSMSAVPSSPPVTLSLGAQIFGDPTNPPPAPQPKHDIGTISPETKETLKYEDEESDSESTDESLVTALASVIIKESPWKDGPSYPPIYLSTTSEYLPPPPTKPKLPPGVQTRDDLEADGKDNKVSWAAETYENSMNMDHVFERFTKRVASEGKQCVRYELNGTPLPFSSDNVFDTLFPQPSMPPLPVTKPDFKVVVVPKRTFDSSKILDCPLCKSKRVFECQLMPNLINVLRSADSGKAKPMTDEERKKFVEKALKGGNSDEKRGMEWGTCMVFSCQNDCCLDDGGNVAKECWREEVVLIQWDV